MNKWNVLVPALLGVLLAGLIGVRWIARPPEVTKSGPPPVAAPTGRSLPLAGTPSCSARGCHGGIESSPNPDRCQQNEYTQWARDPHADAYRALFNERSQKMVRLLGGDKQAHEDPRCLACHVNPALSTIQDAAFVQQERLFGVGCESCHGNASSWLVAHTAPDWRQNKKGFAMPDLADPSVAAKTCAGCHVGAPGRDANHDLIAAGHPRLSFEYGTFQANMPAHWRPTKKSDADLWAAGQIATAQAALDLLAHRADAGPWPEFAEYDCFACHHGLAQPARPTPQRRKPGTLPWGTWYFALTRDLAGPLPALDVLEATMQKPLPDRKQAAAKAREIRGALKVQPGARERILERLKAGTLAAEPSWDSAEQLYLALHALQPSTKLDELAAERSFAPGFDGPRRPFQPRQFIEKLKILQR